MLILKVQFIVLEKSGFLKIRIMKYKVFTNTIKQIENMSKKTILIFLCLTFVLASCSTSRKCDGGKKIKTEMW